MFIALSNASNWLQTIFYFKPIFAAIFVTIATVKVKLISYLYTWAIVLINKNFVKSEFHFLAS